MRSRKLFLPDPAALTLKAQLAGARVSDMWPTDVTGPPLSGSAIMEASPSKISTSEPLKILQAVCRQVSQNV